jgi:hypothetical protein
LSCSKVIDDGLTLFLLPEGKVLLEELDDGLGISEGLFIDVIDLLEGLGKSLLAELASLLMVVHNLVVEHGEVESKTKSDGVASVELLGEDVGLLVALLGTLLDGSEVVTLGGLGNVSVVITDHLLEEGLGLIVGGELEAVIADDANNSEADVVKLLFDLLLVGLESVAELGVLGVLLDGTDGADGATLGADEVLETNGEEVTLINGEVFAGLGLDGLLEEVDHILKSLSLLGNSGKENLLF